MKKLNLLAILGALFLVSKIDAQPITMQSMLRDMVDREKLVEFPTSQYRSLQASSYNRHSISPDKPGWFADSDGIFCIRTEENNGETEWVLMEDDGPGAITKIWAVCFYYGLDNLKGANIKIYLDGDTEPVIFTNFFSLVKGGDFVKPPLAKETTRAGNIYLPIPYAKSCKVTMDQKVFYNIINYQSFPKGTAVKSFNMTDYEDSKFLVDSVRSVLNKGVNSSFNYSSKVEKSLLLTSGESKSVKLTKGSNAVKQFIVKLKSEDIAQSLRSTILKATFDGEQTVWIPVGDFFNNGVGVYPYQMWEREVTSDGTMICRWVMPYQKSGEIEFENLAQFPCEIDVQLYTDGYNWSSNTMHFHSSWRMDDPTPTFPLFDYNLLEVDGKGVYVGDQFTVLNPSEGWWGEGDEKVYVDEDNNGGFPTHFGTGTEDYYGWAGGIVPTPKDEFSVPFLSNVRVGSPNAMGYNTCSRTRVLDAIPFSERLKFDIESSAGTRLAWFHLVYAVSTYWYAQPGAITNREPLPQKAAQTIPTLQDLIELNSASKSNTFVVDGAIEAENLSTYVLDEGVTSNDELQIWGDLSNGKLKGFLLCSEGQSVTVKLTEIFNKVDLDVCLLIGSNFGHFDIYVNGKFVKDANCETTNFSMAVVNIGEHSPIDNSIEVKFVNRSSKAVALGIDYFRHVE